MSKHHRPPASHRAFEQRGDRLAPRSVFLKRLALAVLLAVELIALALFAGVAGYHWIAGLNWVDSLLNASMILGGMGPVNELTSDNAKIFSSFYALFSGLFFIAVLGIVLAPVIHRIIHHFHVETEEDEA